MKSIYAFDTALPTLSQSKTGQKRPLYEKVEKTWVIHIIMIMVMIDKLKHLFLWSQLISHLKIALSLKDDLTVPFEEVVNALT